MFYDQAGGPGRFDTRAFQVECFFKRAPQSELLLVNHSSQQVLKTLFSQYLDLVS